MRIARKTLDDVKASMEVGAALLTDERGLRVITRVTDDQMEAAALLALSIVASVAYGRHEVVRAADVENISLGDFK